MTLTETKPDRVEALIGDLTPVAMARGDVRITDFGASGAIPTGMRRAGRHRRRPVRMGHRLPPPEAALRTFR